MPPETSYIVYTVIVFGISFSGMYFRFKDKIEKTENRMTTIELELKHSREDVKQNQIRLNDHEKQYQAMIALVEKVNTLSNDMAEMKADVKELIRSNRE